MDDGIKLGILWGILILLVLALGYSFLFIDDLEDSSDINEDVLNEDDEQGGVLLSPSAGETNDAGDNSDSESWNGGSYKRLPVENENVKFNKLIIGKVVGEFEDNPAEFFWVFIFVLAVMIVAAFWLDKVL